MPADLQSEDAVLELTRRAGDQLGRIDVWVNCAGVMAYGRFEELPERRLWRRRRDELLRSGARCARRAPALGGQGAGVLINVNSVWGRITTPSVSP
jgi:NAD(P)-dependent dehydrogenase (short-subunit alcohol dehydrogenase family)